MIRPVLAVTMAIMIGASTMASAQTVTFGDAPIGSLPESFDSWRTGEGGSAQWRIVADSSAQGGRALAQTSRDKTDYRFPLAIYRPVSPKDVEVTIHFKPVAGRVDQAGGIAVRLQTPDDYYIARANALEDNVRFYKVVKGVRQQIMGANTKVSSNEWHILTLRAEGNRFTVAFDGKPLFTATDETFPQAGKVALWTKADSVTHFDRVEIQQIQ